MLPVKPLKLLSNLRRALTIIRYCFEHTWIACGPTDLQTSRFKCKGARSWPHLRLTARSRPDRFSATGAHRFFKILHKQARTKHPPNLLRPQQQIAPSCHPQKRQSPHHEGPARPPKSLTPRDRSILRKSKQPAKPRRLGPSLLETAKASLRSNLHKPRSKLSIQGLLGLPR